MLNVGAEFTASIVIDKNDLITQALKQLSTAQKELEKNKLEIYFDLSNADLSKKLKEYQKQLSSTDYTIKINSNGIEETYKSLDKLLDIVKTIASGKDFGTGFGNINADNAVKQIDKLENRISELNKKYDELQKKSTSGSISGKEVNLVDNDEFKKLSQEVSELKGQFDDLKTHMSLLDDYTVPTDRFFELQTQVEATSVKVSDLVDEMTKLSNVQKNLGAETNISSGLKDAFPNGKREKTDNIISTKDIDNAYKINNALDETSEKLKSLRKGLELPDDFSKLESDVKDLNQQLTQGKITVKEYTKQFNDLYNITVKLSSQSELDDIISKNSTRIKNLENSKPVEKDRSDLYQGYINQLDEIQNKIIAIQKNVEAKGFITDEDIDNARTLQESYVKIDNTIKQMKTAAKGSTEASRQKEIDKLNKAMQANTNITVEARQQLEHYLSVLRNGDASTNVEEIHTAWQKVINDEVAAGRGGQSFLQMMKNSGIHKWAADIAGMFSFYDVINIGKQAASIVTDLNTQITDLAKVSEATSKQIYADFDSYADIAKEIGGTISDTISATADWSRNGYNIPDSKELARVALLYKNVGDGIDIDTANESLISTLRGFKMEADEAEKIIDIFNNVSNNEPIDSGGIGEALQRSAASFNAANTSLQESVALISTTNSVIQNPEKVGNMWKVVSMRIRSATSELQEAGEDTDGIVESTADLQKMIKAMTGYDILESDGKTFKSIYDIVLNISKVWDNLSDLDQSSLLQALAGKQQSNALAAALNNPELLKKSYKEAMESAGSAAEEEKKYQQSIQYAIDQTKAKLEELANDTLNSNFLKGAIDAGGKLIDILDGIVKSGNAIPTVFTGIAAVLSAKNNFGKCCVSA